MITNAGLSCQDNLIDALFNQNRFKIVERDLLDLVLQEQKLSRTQLIDRKTALKLGRLVAAKSIVSGSIIESRTGIEIVSRLIDTETSEILAVEDVYDEVKDLSAMISLAQGMANKYHRDFPLADGKIIQIKNRNVFTDIGRNTIRNQRRLIIYREKPVLHPESGIKLGADHEIIGHARITQLSPKMCKAEIVDGKNRNIQQMDKVISE